MKVLVIFFVAVLTVNTVSGQVINHTNINKAGVAIEGFDPVSYQTAGKAVQGNKNYSFELEGVVYYFSSPQNLEKFKNNSAAFIPAYGGWCAFAMGDYGEKVKIDPHTFKVIKGKTYLFYNFYFNNTLDSWNKNEVQLKIAADANWKKLTKNNDK